jgi:hypothetical protein
VALDDHGFVVAMRSKTPQVMMMTMDYDRIRVGSGGAPLSSQTSELGHPRRFERAPGTSAIAPIATESLHCSKLLSSLHRKLGVT